MEKQKEKRIPSYTYKEFEIKKKSGKTRKICNPSPDLKRWQRRQLKRLEIIFTELAREKNVLECFHGFIPKRNAITAATKHIPFEVTMMFDITNFFDSVTTSHIDLVTPLIKKMKYAERLYHLKGYTAQGFPTSPILANIAVIPIIQLLDAFLYQRFGDEYELTIYADDIQISFNDENLIQQIAIEDKLTKLFAGSNLEINANKTRTKYAKFGARRILGVNVTPDGILPTRKTNRKVRAVNHHLKYSDEKQYVYKGLRMWQTCPMPVGAGFAL